MLKEHFQELFDYNAAKNAELCNVLLASKSLPASCRTELGHIIAAQDIWLCRLTGRDYLNIEVWPTPSPEECRAASERSSNDWRDFVAGLGEEDFERRFEYVDTKGQGCETVGRHALAHVINHGTHHRAKIAVQLRAAGSVPPILDFTNFVRKELE